MPPDMMMNAPQSGGMGLGAIGIIFGVLWVVVVLGFVVGYVMIVISAWRAAKAHKSLAQSAKDLIEVLKRRGE